MPVRASSSGKNLTLPVSDPPRDQELDRLIGDDDDDVEEKLFKGSAMSRRGAFAAVSYMACAGKTPPRFLIPVSNVKRSNFQGFDLNRCCAFVLSLFV